MNIGIVGRTMNTIGGVKEFVEGFCYGLSQCDQGEDNFYFFMTEDGTAPTYADGIEVVREGSANKIVWDLAVLPRLVKKYKIDVLLHTKNSMPPSVLGVPSALVVHDMMYFIHPEVYKRSDQFYTRNLMRLSIPRANQIIAVSHNTKKDLEDIFPKIPGERMSVVHENSLPKFTQECTEAELDAFRKKHSLPKDYLLFTGSLSPRKNLERLLQVFATIQDKVEYDLVITGGKAWKQRTIFQVLEELGLEKRVHILGFVEDEDMPLLYKGARVYIYPSLYEGFGIPVLEAYNAGVPVLCSNVSSIPEVAGEAAVYFDPTNNEDMAQKIVDAVNNDALLAELKEKGAARAQEFSWKRSSQQIIDILRRVGNSAQ